jgi:hypothetical protein
VRNGCEQRGLTVNNDKNTGGHEAIYIFKECTEHDHDIQELQEIVDVTALHSFDFID